MNDFYQKTVVHKEDCIPPEYIRLRFESICKTTPTLSNVRLEKAPDGGYADVHTQAAYVAFAIGMRCYERLRKVGEL
jgi:hypothetical protein